MKVDLKEYAQYWIDHYGSVRSAAKELGINHAYLYRLSTGEKDNPSDEVLEKLGLARVVTYFELV